MRRTIQTATAALAGATFLLMASCDKAGEDQLLDPRYQEPEPASITGAVTVEDTGLAGVIITLSGAEFHSTTTDAQGSFAFDELTPGSYTLVLSNFDPDLYAFEVTQRELTASEGAELTADFTGEAIPQPPAGVSDLVAVADGAHRVELAWTDESDNEAEFHLEREVDEGGWSPLDTLGADTTTFADTELTPATTYNYRIRACNDVGCTPWTDEASATTDDVPPVAPSGLVASATGSSTMELEWTDEADNETGFQVERKDGSEGPWSVLDTVAADTTTFADAELEPATAYTYRVRACNDMGCSDWSEEASGTTDDVPPEAPSGLAAQATGSSTVELAWTDESDNETGFQVERKEGEEGTWAVLDTVGTDTIAFSDAALTPATTYTYRLRACNDFGCSPWADEASATTEDVPPEAPTDLEAQSVSSTAIGLQWTDASDNETGFQVEGKEEGEASWGLLATVGPDTATFTHSGLTPATTYVYRVRACNDLGCSAWTAEASAVTEDVAPKAPTNLDAQATSTTTVALTWDDRSLNETGFRIDRREDGGPWSQIGTPGSNATSFDDSGLTPSTGYTYRVRACNAVGCSAFSNESSVTTQTPSGPNLFISDLYIVQATQTPGGTVPLVADRDGYLRVFVLANESNSFQPDVRVDFYQGGTPVHTETITAPAGAVPTSVSEGDLALSWNVTVPAALIQPGLSVLAEVDPGDVASESDETDNLFPAGGSPQVLDVRDTDPFEVTFVPVHQTANGLVGDVSAANAEDFLEDALELLPFAQANWTVHAEYATDAPALESDNGNGAWSTILSEINSLRVAEGASGHYYGVVEVSYGGGIAGMGYVGWPAAIGWDKLPSGSGVAAHEWGHNFDLRHAPGCGAGNPDPAYPYAEGKIGVWGLDVGSLGLGSLALKSPDTHYDFMSYCNPDWISDYFYEAILTYRQTHGAQGAYGAPEPSLLVWGRVEEGRIVLEPAFRVTTRPHLPSGTGEYRLEGLDPEGASLFSVAFQATPVPDAPGNQAHFAFALPLSSFDESRLRSLRVRGGGRAPAVAEPVKGPEAAPAQEPGIRALRGPEGRMAEVTWNAAAHPMALIRNPATGEVLSFARGGTVRIPTELEALEISFSDGLRSTEPVVREVR